MIQQIFVCLTSNDPIARSITLRVFGVMSKVLSDKLFIHHGIRKCFNSHNKQELEATIFAIDRFCENSLVFATSILELISTKIKSKNNFIPFFNLNFFDSKL